ncbi:hypothetical protein GY45DRAFT_1323854 [Cubamyces sp. BRFM 1775]|nr:hypothetical protein GY45DRAFT_1323854 [Cubamyces sp. BRFM 1775]
MRRAVPVPTLPPLATGGLWLVARGSWLVAPLSLESRVSRPRLPTYLSAQHRSTPLLLASGAVRHPISTYGVSNKAWRRSPGAPPLRPCVSRSVSILAYQHSGDIPHQGTKVASRIPRVRRGRVPLSRGAEAIESLICLFSPCSITIVPTAGCGRRGRSRADCNGPFPTS